MGNGHPGWRKTHTANKQTITAFLKNRRSKSNNDIDIVFLGDSITEAWAGRSLNKLCHPGIKNVFDELFGDRRQSTRFRALALGIAGDDTINLLYRIQNGEMPDKLNPCVWWVLIGTNDIRMERSVDETFKGIVAVINEIRERKPTSIIVVNGILPSTEHNSKDGRLYEEMGVTSEDTGDEKGGGRIYHLWSFITAINQLLADFCNDTCNVNLVYFEAAHIFLNDGGTHIRKELMNDFLHPTALGHRLWGEAILQWLHSRFKVSPTPGAASAFE